MNTLQTIMSCYAVLWLLALCVGGIAAFCRRGSANPEIKGIGGWLLFFLITRLVGLCFSILRETLELSGTLEQVPHMRAGIYLAEIPYLILSLLWLACFYLLLRTRKKAVRTAKILLALDPLVTLLSPAFLLCSLQLTLTDADFLSLEAAERFYSNFQPLHFALQCLISFIWYMYFSLSKRVRNTWKQD
ncbi:MAG: DUF2569 family protein [Desulfovibrio sp.]|nr:DUF2569 family protein [Desulfovibrio sp.]